MADVKLTAAQQAVVDHRGGALLVSAAAGSGKTKVLVDRLLGYICDSEKPCNIDDFLVITYTKAAAAELRVKIAQALSQRLAQAPEDRHLQRQMHRIYLAEISTVHAFCANLLRTYAHLLDISADFRVAEELESQTLQDKVLEQLLEQGYAQGDPDFLAMVEAFGYGRDDRRLPEAVKMAHREMRCRADMDRWLEETLQALDMSQYTDAAETPWGQYLLREFRSFLDRQIEKFHVALAEMAFYPKLEKGFGKTFRENLAQLERLRACETWDQLLENKILSFGRAIARNPENEAVKTRLAKVRTLCWTELKKWQDRFFAGSGEILADLAETAPGAQALLRFAKTFDQAYAAEKKRRKILDFSDLEHTAIRLLTDRSTGKPTRIAREISQRFVEIMVDEYQDSNQVQDTIFEAVSQEGKNRFMVGDVKQSIYRFRLADPGLFLDKYACYRDGADVEPGEPRKILLSDNFRSRPEILAACNDVFRLVMRRSVGDLDYGDAEALRPGRSFPPVENSPVELHCLTHTGQEGPAPDKCDLEAAYAARRIRRLLDEKTPISDGEGTRPVEPGDIVILMRSLSGTASAYLEALGRCGIPAVCDRGGSLLDTSEVQILTAILQIIDNPHQDVPLLTAMASPAFGFSPDQLARPRVEDRRSDYYDTICTAAETDEAMADFLQTLEALREDAHWMNLHELVDSVFRRTGLLQVFAAMDDGPRRERNLMAFRAFVVSFETTGSKALPQLLWYLSDLQAAGGQLPVPKAASENAVTIMTVHSSKGLEFPVVLLCDLSRRFNMRDMQDAVLVDDDLAVGYNHVDHQRFVRYPTLAKEAIALKKTREAVSEELRVLYVAMTRAKDRLIMSYYSRYLVSELENINSQLTMPLGDDLCASARSPGMWILMAALCRTESGAILNLVGGNDVSRVWDTEWDVRFEDLAQSADAASEMLLQTGPVAEPDRESVNLLAFRYPYQAVSNVPGKLTATQLKGRIQDQEAAEGAVEPQRPAFYRFQRPSFLPHALTPQERGTATHLFMQFARYDQCSTAASIQGELRRLTEEEFLTPEQAEAVETGQIQTFFRSELGQWLLQAPQVCREFKFSILVDAGAYVPQAVGEQVMLQGVVDCFVPDTAGIVILDFKTDRVGKDPSERANHYRPQLDAYAEALSKIYGLPVKEKILYFFAAGKAVYL